MRRTLQRALWNRAVDRRGPHVRQHGRFSIAPLRAGPRRVPIDDMRRVGSARSSAFFFYAHIIRASVRASTIATRRC